VGSKRRARRALLRPRRPLAALGLPQLLAPRERARHQRVGVAGERAVEQRVGEHGHRLLDGPAAQLVERSARGLALRLRLGDGLRRLGAVGARAQHDVGRGAPGRQPALGDARLLLHQRQRRAVHVDHARRAGVGEVAALHVGGELPRRAGEGGVLRVAQRAAGVVVRAHARREQRLLQPHARLLGERERGVDVRRERAGAGELVERAVRRVHEVAEVHDPVQARAPGVERQRGQVEPDRLAHRGAGAVGVGAGLPEGEVLLQGGADVGAEGVGLRVEPGRGQEQTEEEQRSERHRSG
jgi:hypothetical protein